jgi:hypothetical protein
VKRLSDILSGSTVNPEVLRAARARVVLDKWEEAIGEFLADKCVPDTYDHGLLWVSTTGAEWGQEIQMRREEIMDRLNEFADEKLFTGIRVSQRKSRKPRRG